MFQDQNEKENKFLQKNFNQEDDLKIEDIPIYTMAKDLEEIEHPEKKAAREAAMESSKIQTSASSLTEKQRTSPFLGSAPVQAPKPQLQPEVVRPKIEEQQKKRSFFSSLLGSSPADKQMAEKKSPEQRAMAEKRIAEQKAAEARLAEAKRMAEQKMMEQKTKEEEMRKLKEREEQRVAEERRLMEQKVLAEKRIAEQKAMETRLAEAKKMAEQKAEEKRLMEQKDLEEKRIAQQKTAEMKLAEAKKMMEQRAAAEKMMTEKRAAEQRMTEQKIAEQKTAVKNQIKDQRIQAMPESPHKFGKTLAIGIPLFIVVILSVSLYYFYVIQQKNTPPVKVVENPVPEPTPIPEPVATPTFSLDKPNYLQINTTAADKTSLKETLKKYAADVKKSNALVPLEFIITDQQNNPVDFTTFATLSGMTLPMDILADLDKNFSLFIYNDAANARLGLAVTAKNSLKLKSDLAKEELALGKDLEPILLATDYKLVTTPFGKSTYNNADIRFQNIISPEDLSVDYTIKGQQLLIGTTKMTLRAIIDSLNAQNAPSQP